MTQIALLHRGPGTPTSVHDVVARLRADGHAVRVVDVGGAHDLVRSAVKAVADLPDGFAAVGFAPDEPVVLAVATLRAACGVLLLPAAGPGLAGAGLAGLVRTSDGWVDALDHRSPIGDPPGARERDGKPADQAWSRALAFLRGLEV